MKKLLLVIVLMITFLSASASDKYEIMTENYPPFNYMKDGEPRGIVSGVVSEIQKRIGWSEPVHLYSWNRAYSMVKNESGKILFSMAKTDIRTPFFKWVGPVALIKGSFFKNRNADRTPKNVDDIKNNFVVGVRENSNIHSNFIKEGYKNIIPLENTEAYYRGLAFKRIELIIASPYNIPVRAKKYGLDAELFEKTPVRAGTGKLYIAFSKDTPDAVITKWSGALESMRSDGSLNKLIKKGLSDAEGDFNIKFNYNEL